MAGGPQVNIPAPEATAASPFGIVKTVPRAITAEDFRVMGGWKFRPPILGDLTLLDACSDDLNPAVDEDPEFVKPTNSMPALIEGEAFALQTAAVCLQVGPDEGWFEAAARAHMDSQKSRTLEFAVWENPDDAATPFLAAPDPDPGGATPVDFTGGQVYSLALGMAVLGAQLTNRIGGRGYLHMTQASGIMLATLGGCFEQNGVMFQKGSKHRIVIGAGYTGTGPGRSAVSGSTHWAFGTANLMRIEDDGSLSTMPESFIEAYDKETGRVTFYSECEEVVAWQDTARVGLQVDMNRPGV